MRTKKDILQQILMNSDRQISLLTETNTLLIETNNLLNEMVKFWEKIEKHEKQLNKDIKKFKVKK